MIVPFFFLMCFFKVFLRCYISSAILSCNTVILPQFFAVNLSFTALSNKMSASSPTSLIKGSKKERDEQIKPNDGSGTRYFVLQMDPDGASETPGIKSCSLDAREL